jgi:hypothetical protein
MIHQHTRGSHRGWRVANSDRGCGAGIAVGAPTEPPSCFPQRSQGSYASQRAGWLRPTPPQGTRTAAHHSVNDLKRTVTPGHGGHRAGECFQRCRVWQWACQNVGIGMNVNNHPTSANLGVFVVLGIVPIMVYVVVILVLPWVGRGFH